MSDALASRVGPPPPQSRGVQAGLADPPWEKFDHLSLVLALGVLEFGEQFVDRATRGAEKLLAVAAYVVNDQVVGKGIRHGQGFMSSSGVQRTGGSYPRDRSERWI